MARAGEGKGGGGWGQRLGQPLNTHGVLVCGCPCGQSIRAQVTGQPLCLRKLLSHKTGRRQVELWPGPTKRSMAHGSKGGKTARTSQDGAHRVWKGLPWAGMAGHPELTVGLAGPARRGFRPLVAVLLRFRTSTDFYIFYLFVCVPLKDFTVIVSSLCGTLVRRPGSCVDVGRLPPGLVFLPALVRGPGGLGARPSWGIKIFVLFLFFLF